jgi:hypothetical protein
MSKNRYRLKSNPSIVCEAVESKAEYPPWRQAWYDVSYSDEKLQGYTFQMPAKLFEECWEAVPEKVASNQLVVETNIRYRGLKVYLQTCDLPGRDDINATKFSERVAAWAEYSEKRLCGITKKEPIYPPPRKHADGTVMFPELIGENSEVESDE